MGDSKMGSKGNCAHHIPLDRTCDACLVWAAGRAPAIEREALKARAEAAEQRVAILLECDTTNRTEMVRADAVIGELRARVASLDAENAALRERVAHVERDFARLNAEETALRERGK